MSLNIKNAAVIELARELAESLGTTQVAALQIALEEKLSRQRAGADARRDDMRSSLEHLRARVGAGPSRATIDGDLYDGRGLPR